MVSTPNYTKAQLLKRRLTVAFLLLLNLHPFKAVSMLYTALWFYFNDDRIKKSHEVVVYGNHKKYTTDGILIFDEKGKSVE